MHLIPSYDCADHITIILSQQDQIVATTSTDGMHVYLYSPAAATTVSERFIGANSWKLKSGSDACSTLSRQKEPMLFTATNCSLRGLCSIEFIFATGPGRLCSQVPTVETLSNPTAAHHLMLLGNFNYWGIDM